ncbi:alpha/beta hydrolase [Polaribacter porphyrae]|uniref:AB hydrolase-1 domain-containing protein n=1 Tax=Polaribacter porphyrae TaxID=1137780 RepID=A0A2S7WJP3_9FLAO|nr:alpha/beta hydrolase [Polaribacter porphyrae]PQJ77828.1 hypothetical protein BTO18_00900 [Polaribacter porphyrae]
MTAQEWKEKGKYVTISDKKLFVIDEGSSSNTLVILHGYPTSSYHYYRVLPELAKHFRVVVHDHLGFGFSEKPDSLTYSLIDQADIAIQLWLKLGLKNITILAHDYGTSIAQEILARKNNNLIPLKITMMLLCHSSMRLEHLHLKNVKRLLKDRKLGKFISRLTNFGYKKIKRRFKKDNLSYNINKDYDINKMWNQLDSDEGQKEIHFLSTFINERYTFWHRWTNALRESETPVKIFWEKSDPVIIKEIAIVLAAEDVRHVEWIENEKHFSVLESPKPWMEMVFEKQFKHLLRY